MRERVVIAMAMACEPSLMIAGEPTTARDVTVQAEILGLIEPLKRENGVVLLFITHDMAVVAQMADRVATMYCGSIVEGFCCAFAPPTLSGRRRGMTRRRQAARVWQDQSFKGRVFTAEVILWAVRWSLMFPISYRDLTLTLLDRGVEVDHTTSSAGVQVYAAGRSGSAVMRGPQIGFRRALPPGVTRCPDSDKASVNKFVGAG